MARKSHPNKEVEAAIQYAEANDWKVKEGGHWDAAAMTEDAGDDGQE